MNKVITQKYLKSIIHYDEKTGFFKKIKCRRGDWIGKRAGTVMLKGYRSISIHNKRYLAHRLAWLYMTGDWPYEIDHINRDRDDNRFCNLRLATDSENMHNQGKRKNNTSGFKGVSFNKTSKKWVAQIKINWKNKYLGTYDTPEKAHLAYCKASKKYHGDFARAS